VTLYISCISIFGIKKSVIESCCCIYDICTLYVEWTCIISNISGKKSNYLTGTWSFIDLISDLMISVVGRDYLLGKRINGRIQNGLELESRMYKD